MTKEEFCKLTEDTDAFMKEHGYLPTNEMAEMWQVTPSRVRQLVIKGLAKDVRVGQRRYVKVTDFPVERRWNK